MFFTRVCVTVCITVLILLIGVCIGYVFAWIKAYSLDTNVVNAEDVYVNACVISTIGFGVCLTILLYQNGFLK